VSHYGIPLLDLLQEADEHRLRVRAPIVAECVLVKVRLQIVMADCMIDAGNAALHQAPKAFHGIGVNVAHDVNLLAVVDATMHISLFGHMRNAVVGRKFIRENGVFRHHVLTNCGQ